MKIYTKTGDKGETSLAGGKRIKKSDELLEAYGTIDELSASLGLIIAEVQLPELDTIQRQLFTIGGMLATEVENWSKYWKPETIKEDISQLEKMIDEKSEVLQPLKSFILPQGSRLIAQTHLSRTICRRAERRIAVLTERQNDYFIIMQYINRLSDFLFVLARYFHKTHNIDEKYW